MDNIVKNPYSRNLWHIMKTFKVLPTDERFTDLTDEQIGFILGNMIYDNKQEEWARKGVKPGSQFEDPEDDYWDKDDEDFEVLKTNHDEEDIAKQVETLTGQENLAKVRERFKSAEEWSQFLEEGGALAEKVEKQSYIQEQLEKLYKDAKDLEDAGVSKWGETQEQKLGLDTGSESVDLNEFQDALSLFNGEDLNMPTLDDDDDYI